MVVSKGKGRRVEDFSLEEEGVRSEVRIGRRCGARGI